MFHDSLPTGLSQFDCLEKLERQDFAILETTDFSGPVTFGVLSKWVFVVPHFLGWKQYSTVCVRNYVTVFSANYAADSSSWTYRLTIDNIQKRIWSSTMLYFEQNTIDPNNVTWASWRLRSLEKPRSHMHCNLLATALPLKNSCNQRNHLAIKTATFSCRSVDNQSAINRRPVGDRLARFGRKEVSLTAIKTSWRPNRTCDLPATFATRGRPVGDRLATPLQLPCDCRNNGHKEVTDRLQAMRDRGCRKVFGGRKEVGDWSQWLQTIATPFLVADWSPIIRRSVADWSPNSRRPVCDHKHTLQK